MIGLFFRDKSIVFSLASRASLLAISFLALNDARTELALTETSLYFKLTYLFLFLNSVLGAISSHAIRRMVSLENSYWYHEFKAIVIKQGLIILLAFCILTALYVIDPFDIIAYCVLCAIILFIVPLSQFGMILLKGQMKVHVYESFLFLVSLIILFVIFEAPLNSALKIIVIQFAPIWLAGFISGIYSIKLVRGVVLDKQRAKSLTLADYKIGFRGGVIGSISKFGLQFLYSSIFEGSLVVQVLYIRRYFELIDAPIAVIFNAILPRLSSEYREERVGYIERKKALIFTSTVLYVLSGVFLLIYLIWDKQYVSLYVFLAIAVLLYLQRVSSFALVFRSIEDRAIDNIVASTVLTMLSTIVVILLFLDASIFLFVVAEIIVSLVIIKKYYAYTLFGSRSNRF